MPLILTEEQIMLRDSARSFLARNAPIAHMRQLRDSRDPRGFSDALWKSFAEMGWAGILVPENHGGMGLGYVEAGVVAEETGHTLTPSPFLSSAVLGATAIMKGGSDAHKSEYLPRIATGDLVAALAVDETSKHRPKQTSLSAKRSGNGFIINGSKTFVLDGHAAGLLIVAARTAGAPGEEHGLTLFAIESSARGLKPERMSIVDSRNAARLVFDNVSAGTEAVIGGVDAGWAILDGTLNAGRACVAAEMTGVSDEVFNRTVSYLKERRQFAKLIGEFQALQHRAARLYCEIEVTRSAVLKALQALDGNFDKAGPIASVAKARAGVSATLAVNEAVQMHGGIGMTDEFDAGLFMKRVRVDQELFGDANFHADQLARLNHY